MPKKTEPDMKKTNRAAAWVASSGRSTMLPPSAGMKSRAMSSFEKDRENPHVLEEKYVRNHVYILYYREEYGVIKYSISG